VCESVCRCVCMHVCVNVCMYVWSVCSVCMILYACMYLCMYICMSKLKSYVLMHICYMCKNVRMFDRYMHVFKPTITCIYTCMHPYVCMLVQSSHVCYCMRARMHVHMYHACTYASSPRKHPLSFLHLLAYICTPIHTWHTYIYTRIYPYMTTYTPGANLRLFNDTRALIRAWTSCCRPMQLQMAPKARKKWTAICSRRMNTYSQLACAVAASSKLCVHMMCVCMYICVYVLIFLCVYVCICVCMHICMYLRMCIHMCMMFSSWSISKWLHVWTYTTRIDIYTHAHDSATYTYMCFCMYISV